MQNDVSPAWNHSEQSVGSGKGVLVEVGRISVAAASFFSGVWRISVTLAKRNGGDGGILWESHTEYCNSSMMVDSLALQQLIQLLNKLLLIELQCK